jgi:methylmalonyl-CoA/ethylmalonyl-CoA epimerase
MLDKIDHIGIAVTDLDQVRATMLKAFGLQPSFEEEVSDQKLKIIGYKIGESNIEYFEPSAPDSPIAKFLEKRGNAIHHIAYCVKNLAQTLEKLKVNGFIPIDEQPREGAEGKKIAFLHPKDFNGVLIELCQE